MADTPSEAVCVYGAQIIKKHLDSLVAEVDGVLAGKDIEAIHRMRVASRRMRSALGLFSDCFARQEHKFYLNKVRKLTQSLGEARDLDVQLELIEKVLPSFADVKFAPGVKRLQLRLKQKRQNTQHQVNAAMNRMVESSVLEKIDSWAEPWLTKAGAVYLFSPALYERAFIRIKTRLDELFIHVPYVSDPLNVSELHAMRISAKRLRYTLEAFESLYGNGLKPYINQTRKLQDLLGTIHDLDVWIAYIPQFIAEEQSRIVGYFGNNRPLKRLLPGLEAFRQSRISARQSAYAEFMTEWQENEKQGVWEMLLRLINAPINIDEILKAFDANAENSPSDQTFENMSESLD